jgi:hypothetical protein
MENLCSQGSELDFDTLEKLNDFEASYLLRKKMLHRQAKLPLIKSR